ncbi:hypothetical protein DUNSADRAFT_4070 [Dunaliella salina]|uniref:CRAL-TRIO domain-containing protein n=1 Tax=Dunaliella salina TaxID=3046 RepID=A0ABQ7GSP8_DUNSA|nr:hypothetical protein DUNSADRAFT_4070 [Dunaliella salina]|eukprot:KAF5837639.1 hypothetical protein DUNSADRAFT_4070 [Dunaliella salina]
MLASWLSSWLPEWVTDEGNESTGSHHTGIGHTELQQDGRLQSEAFQELGFLKADKSWRDVAGRQVLLVSARKFPASKVLDLEDLYKYIHVTVSSIDGPYAVVWLHTCATYYDNCPSISWLWSTYARLPERFKTNLEVLHIVHCDATLWAATLGLSTTIPDLWHKISR